MGLVDPSGQPIASSIEALSDEELTDQFEREIHHLAQIGPMVLDLEAADLMRVVGLLQMVARNVTTNPAAADDVDTVRAVMDTAEVVVMQALREFRGYPAILEVIRRGGADL